MGEIHMSYEDFCRMTPEEFGQVYKAHADYTGNACKDGWQRMRTLAAITIQPHVKSRVTPRQLLPLPWDTEETGRAATPPVPKEEAKRRMMGKVKVKS